MRQTTGRLSSYFAALAALLCFASLASAQNAALDKFVAQLKTESAGVVDFEDKSVRPRFEDQYPHPNLPALDPAVAGPEVLKVLAGKLTGNAYADTYIRWHLQPLVDQYLEYAFKQYLTTGEHKIDPALRRQLTDILKSLPAESDKPTRLETMARPGVDPKVYDALKGQIDTVNATTRVRVGVPPYDRNVTGSAALEYVGPRRQAEVKAAIEELRKLNIKLREIEVDDDVAKLFNERQRETNSILRNYRGNLLFALLKSGDPASLAMIGDEITKQVRQRQQLGIELMQYLYAAMYEGYLLLYDEAALAALRSSLVAAARSADEPDVYMFGSEPPPFWYKPKYRNFADLAFHMIHVLDTPGTLEMSRYAVTAPPPPAPTAVPTGLVKPDGLTMGRIRGAISGALAAFYAPPPQNNFMLPHFLPRSMSDLHSAQTFRANSPYGQFVIHETGSQSLITWAMIAAGESYQNPFLYQRLSFALSADTPYTYDHSMRLQLLSNLSTERWQPWFDRDYKWLTNAYNTPDSEGGLASLYGPDGPVGDYSNADAQYGTLALWAIEQSGRPVPDKVWQVIDNYWRAEQHAPDSSGAAGWSVGLIHGKNKLDDNNTNRFALEVIPPMTAAGAAALSLSERYLYAEKLGDVGASDKLPHLQRAVDWLDQHFALDGKSPGVNWYFYLWNIQRVAHANGIRTLHGVDLFRDATAFVLSKQRSDGTWEDESLAGSDDRRYSRLTSTAFALLYLSDAVNSAVGVSKVKFNGNWNNRPHDLWNFVEHASDEYEAPTVWQIVDLKLPLDALLESPLLYLATDDGFDLTDAEVNRLREYLDAGGMLLLNSDKTSPNVARSFDKLIAQLYPGAQMTDVAPDHPFYNLHAAANAGLAMKILDNGVRPVIVQFVRDIGRDLQTHPDGDAPAFALLNNIYLYAVGLNANRNRIDTPLLPASSRPFARSVKVAQLLPAPEPSAMKQLRTFCRANLGLDVQVAAIKPGELNKDQRVAFLTTPPGYVLSDDDAKAIRDWLTTSGGTLWLDAAGGTPGAIDAMTAALAKIEPQARPVPLAFDSPILTGKDLPGGFDNARVRYRYALLSQMGASNSPRLQQVAVAGRDNAIILSAEDLTAGLAGLAHWNILGYEPDTARQLVANGLLTATK